MRSMCMYKLESLATDEIKLIYCYNYYRVHGKLPLPDNYSREKTIELTKLLTRQIIREDI